MLDEFGFSSAFRYGQKKGQRANNKLNKQTYLFFSIIFLILIVI
ncbi:hypothetical protein CY0110_31110 [Crocosphaera chwakensis CCY0110]|uniref:Uncharacterized protein n=1 Tax=Crocosphaera chwakensis CCY0110 TaxID=391612 RepID=A3IYU9_9CHRO|nr:hypothetical protein CY0110_31110 [Crocosphaera chwakensis CCY0110]